MWDETRDVSREARIVRLYIATQPNRATEGLSALPLRYVMADTGLDRSEVETALSELETAGIIFWDAEAEMVFDPSALVAANINKPDDNRIAGAVKVLRTHPRTHLEQNLLEAAERLAPLLVPAIRDAIPEYGRRVSARHRHSEEVKV
jgi:hypothetical protein